MMIRTELQSGRSNFFAEICAVFLTVYIHWSYLRFVNNKLLLMMIFAFAMLNFLLRTDRTVRWQGFQNIFVCLLLYCSVGSAYSPNASAGVRFLLQMLLAFGVYLIMIDDVDFLRSLFRWIGISGIASVLAIILQVLFPDEMLALCAKLVKPSGYAMTVELYSYGYYSGLSGYNCIAGFHAASIMGMFFVKGLKGRYAAKRIRNYAIAAISLFALVATQKRGVLLAAIIALVVTLVYFFMTQKRLGKILQMLFIIAMLAGILYGVMLNTEVGQTMLRRFTESEDISSGRFDSYQYILSNIQGHLLLGYGTGAMNVGIGNNAHNIYLQILYDHGVFGLCIYLIFFAIPLVDCIRKIKHGNSSESVLTSLFLQVLFLCYGFTGNPLYDFCLFILYLMAILLKDIGDERKCDGYESYGRYYYLS